MLMRRFALGATLSLFLALSFGSVAYGSELNEEPGVLGEGQAALADQPEAFPGAASAVGDTGSDGGAQSENSGSSDLIAGSGNEDASGPEDAVPPTGGSEGDAMVVPDGSIGDESDAQAGGNASSDAEDGVGGGTSGGSGDENDSDGSPNPPQDGDSEGDGPQEPAEPEKPAIPEKVEDGAYIIDSSLGKTLDVKSGSKKDKGNVQTYTKNYSAAQRYYIKATGQVGSGE